MIVAVTGHRPDRLGGYIDYNFHYAVKLRMLAAFAELGAAKIISGLAQGADWLAIESATMLGLPYVAAIPFIGQESKWPWSARDQYNKYISGASETVIVCEGGYSSWKLQKRNEWMVDHCDVVLAVWDGSKGGTQNCLNYAVKQNKIIYHIPIYIENGELHAGQYQPYVYFKDAISE